MSEPTFIYRDGMLADTEYVQWLHEVKSRYRQCQVKAAVRVNTAMLEFYWSMGRDIVAMQAEAKWGSGFFNQLSLDMRAMFPGETGFSSANLRYMKRWYEFYYQTAVNLHQAGEEIFQQADDEILHQPSDVIVHQAGEELKMPTFFGIVPWKHHVRKFNYQNLYFEKYLLEIGDPRSSDYDSSMPVRMKRAMTKPAFVSVIGAPLRHLTKRCTFFLMTLQILNKS